MDLKGDTCSLSLTHTRTHHTHTHTHTQPLASHSCMHAFSHTHSRTYSLNSLIELLTCPPLDWQAGAFTFRFKAIDGNSIKCVGSRDTMVYVLLLYSLRSVTV